MLVSAALSTILSLHLTLVTLAVTVSYVHRDVWPLMTVTLRPLDESEGAILWMKVALTLFASVVEPLLEPHLYTPVNPKEPMLKPNPEQTASVISYLFYTFLDPIIWLAYRVPHLSHDQLPPLCDTDYVKNLIQRSYPVRSFIRVPISCPHHALQYLDPFFGAKKRNLIFGLIIVFRRSLCYQSLLLVGLVSGHSYRCSARGFEKV